VGSRVRVKVRQRTSGPPFRNAEFDILYKRGHLLRRQRARHGGDARIVDKSGAWFSYGEPPPRSGPGERPPTSFKQKPRSPRGDRQQGPGARAARAVVAEAADEVRRRSRSPDRAPGRRRHCLRRLRCQRGRRYEPPPLSTRTTAMRRRNGTRLLAVTDRSRVELQRRLERRGYAPETAIEAVDRLQARGWVDDKRLAEDLARRRLSHGYGRRRVVADLVSRRRSTRRRQPDRGGARRGAGGRRPDRRRPAPPRPFRPPDGPEVRRIARRPPTAWIRHVGHPRSAAPDGRRGRVSAAGRGLTRHWPGQPDEVGAPAPAPLSLPAKDRAAEFPAQHRAEQHERAHERRNPKSTSPSKDARLTATHPTPAPMAPPAARVTV